MKKKGRSKSLFSRMDSIILTKLFKNKEMCITELIIETGSGNKDLLKRLKHLVRHNLIIRQKTKTRKINYSINKYMKQEVITLLKIFTNFNK